MTADFYHAESESGLRVDDPTEIEIRGLVRGLDRDANTFVTVESDDAPWYGSIAVADDGGYEVVLSDPSGAELDVATEPALRPAVRRVVEWAARRDFRGRRGARGAPRPDVTELARFAGVDKSLAVPLPWEQAGARWLPGDYREFVDVFGHHELRETFGVRGPRRQYGVGQLAAFVGQLSDGGAEAFEQMLPPRPDGRPFTFHPEPGGLLCWGENFRGDHCFWSTEGTDPDRWPVLLWLRAEPDRVHRYDMGMARFLLWALSGADPVLNELIPEPAESPL
jgi:hypothetical protein